MFAVDTNILVRIIVNDHPEQAKLALKTIAKKTVFITKTVLLETEWVLRYSYQLTRSEIIPIFERLLGLPNNIIENHAEIIQALTWFADGLDFADALHLASSTKTKAFITFDNKFSKKANNLKGLKIPVINLL